MELNVQYTVNKELSAVYKESVDSLNKLLSTRMPEQTQQHEKRASALTLTSYMKQFEYYDSDMAWQVERFSQN